MWFKSSKPLDWQGQEVRCDDCVHLDLSREERCRKKHVCMRDRSPDRIAQFFKKNPELANEFLTHPYFEVRAEAAKVADVFHLTALLDDEDESVRWNAALRLPHRFMVRLRNDPHREVRIRIASQLEGEELIPMMSDPDYYVRQVVARRIAVAQLRNMIDDPDPEVRREVAKRIAPEWLSKLVDDPDAGVCLAVTQRLDPAHLLPLRTHADFRVRYEVAGLLPLRALDVMRKDPDPLVRERVEERIADARKESDPEHLANEKRILQWDGRKH
jgi:hypothetical protein